MLAGPCSDIKVVYLMQPYSCLCSWSGHGRSFILCKENERRRHRNEFGDL